MRNDDGLKRRRQAVLYHHPERRDFFVEEARKRGLDPIETTTFEWLELDDKVSHAQAAA
jgi:hypothetical protein